MPSDSFSYILPETIGLMLCKVTEAGTLRQSEPVYFTNGRDAVIAVLKRAQISGDVSGEVDTAHAYWADQLDAEGDTIGEVRLDRGSWNALKNRWMRCRMQAN